MIPVFRQHLGDHIATIVVVGAMGGAITYIEVARPSLSQIASMITFQSEEGNKPSTPVAPAPVPADVKPAEPAPAVVAPAPAPTPPPPAVKKAVTNSFVHMRAGKGTQFPIVMDLEAGTEVELRDDSNSQWQGIIYQGKPGYLFKAYVTYQ